MSRPAEQRAALTDEQAARFWSKVDKTDTCWLWTAGHNGDGYGYFKANKITVGAHRVAYLLLRGPIPEGLQLDHICRVPACVNPDHLEPVTGSVNLLRGLNPWAVNKRRTHCVHGHEFTPENTFLKHGNRQCLTCKRADDARYKREARRRQATG